MADTVKKSRIVSEEDNLEESLLEEFNMRLKNCMSQDNLQQSDEEDDEKTEENSMYESITLKKDACIKSAISSRDFIQNETEHYYEEPAAVVKNGTSQNGHYENLPTPPHQNSDKTDLPTDQYVEMHVEKPEAEYEDMEEATYQVPRSLEPPPNFSLKTDLCKDMELDLELDDGRSSVKDRMFLSTDDASCLLFTQTVTSPMLTPSEENIDFLKGFQQESPPASKVTDLDEDKEKIYENLKLENQEEAIYENLKPQQENIYENIPPPTENPNEATLTASSSTEEFLIHERALAEEPTPSETYTEFVHHTTTSSNYHDKYTEVVAKNAKNVEVNREKDTETVPAQIVHNLMTQFTKKSEMDAGGKKDVPVVGGNELKTINIMKQIHKFEQKQEVEEGAEMEEDWNSTVTESYVETTVETRSNGSDKGLKKKKTKKSRKEEKENISVKSSFSKFDALQKKNVLHVRSSDSSKAQEKFNGAQADTTNCKACAKAVFQMEQIKAEKAVWHKNCFRCTECNKQLTVDTYQSHEGSLYCKPHFKALFTPKAVEDEAPPSDKPDLGLEELQSLNVKERFQVFEHYQSETSESDRGPTPINVKRSPSILSKLARFQAKGMDVGVADESLNGIPIEESTSEEEEPEEQVDGEDADLVRAKRVQKEKPFHFTGMSDVKNKWEHGEQNSRDERREERKQEIQSIRNRLFMGKQGKMKEAYQQAVMESESCTNLLKKSEKIESCDTKSLKERFEKGELAHEKLSRDRGDEEEEVYESEISKKSRSLFLELDANASKAPQITPVTPPKLDVKKAREADTPDREIYRDPEVVRAEEFVEDSVIAKETHTATKMLNKFRQMEENLSKDQTPSGPKPLKRFTPPPEPARPESNSEEDSGSEEEEEDDEDEVDHSRLPQDLIEAQKAARAKQLRAKFERWEANEIKREQNNSSINIVEELGEDQSQVESAKSLRARFESMRETSSDKSRTPRVKVNRFVDIATVAETCQSCNGRVYPLEKISVHGLIYHKKCFKCMECSCVLRMDSYSYNQGLLYCIPHFKRLFISKGNYDTGFGLGQHKEKWTANAATIA